MNGFPKRHRIAIDLGGHKIALWAAQENAEGKLEVLGSSHMASAGIGPGMITDVHALEKVLVSCLYDMQTRCHVHVQHADIVLNGAFFTNEYVHLQAPITTGTVTIQDYAHILQRVQKEDFFPAHIIPLDFTVDYQRGIKNPIGMVGKYIEAAFYVLWIPRGLYHTLRQCFKRCELSLQKVIHSSYADGFSCLSEDERTLGAVLCNIGLHSTNISIFHQGTLRGAHTIPIGGGHVSLDIARGCGISMQTSERLKILHGAALGTPHDRREMIELPLAPDGQGAPQPLSLSCAFLVKIVQARYEELLRAVKSYLHAQNVHPGCISLVCAGGGSAIPGLKELAHNILKVPMRIAAPRMAALSPSYHEAFSCVAGALCIEPTPLERLLTEKRTKKNFFSWMRKKYDTIMNR